MYGIRKVISGSAVASLAMLGSLVVASAPGASGGNPQRAFSIGVAARSQPPRVLDVVRSGAIPHARASAKLDSTLARVIRAGRIGGAGGIRPAGLATTGGGRVRVIVESRRPELARASIEALGGRVERISGSLVQAAVAAGNLAALSRRPEVGRVRAPFASIETAVSGEGVSSTLAVTWHEQGFRGEGVKVGVIDAGFEGLAQRQADSDLPANVVMQDFCGGGFSTATEHGTAVAEIVHEMAPEAQL